MDSPSVLVLFCPAFTALPWVGRRLLFLLEVLSFTVSAFMSSVSTSVPHPAKGRQTDLF